MIIAVVAAAGLAILAKKGKLGDGAKAFMDKIFKGSAPKVNKAPVAPKVEPVAPKVEPVAPKVEPVAPKDLAYQETVDQFFSKHHDAMQKIDNVLDSTKIGDGILSEVGIKPGTTWGEFFRNSVHDSAVTSSNKLYHGTTPKAKESILKNGFDLNYVKHHESGRGFYFALEDAGAEIYAKDAGGKLVAQLAPDVKIAKIDSLGANSLINCLKGNADVSLTGNLRKEFGLKMVDAFDKETIMDEYFIRKLASMGYGGVETASQNARCRYVAIFDPKNIKIVE